MKENKKVRKQENTRKRSRKNERKHGLDLESDQEKKTITVKKKRRKTRACLLLSTPRGFSLISSLYIDYPRKAME